MDLPALLDKADQGSWPVEAALLYDLQKVGVDHERDIYALDLVTWLTSGGRRPIKRPLPSQRLVRITKHLRSAAQRLTQARLSDDERQHLARLLQAALHHCEERLRGRFRPVLTDALSSVGLQPANPPERTAFARMIEEMLDRIVELGFLTFSDLRDTISRNQLKMPDLGDPQEFVRGDPLLRLDRRLATALDGVYRPSEVYLRWLERLTAPAFGTVSGRWLVLFVLLPFGGAAVMVQGAQVLVGHFQPAVVPSRGDQGEEAERPAPSEDAEGSETSAERIGVEKLELPLSWKLAAIALLGLFLLALLHVESFRQGCKQTLVLTYRALRGLLIDLPVYLARRPLVQKALKSWAFQLLWSFAFKPAVVCAVLWWLLPKAFASWQVGCITFLLVAIVLNSRCRQGRRRGADAIAGERLRAAAGRPAARPAAPAVVGVQADHRHDGIRAAHRR